MNKWMVCCATIVFCHIYPAEKPQKREPAVLERKAPNNNMLSIEAIDFNYDGSLIAIGGHGFDSHLNILQVSNFKNILPYKETRDIITYVKFGKKSNLLLSCRQNGKMVLSNLQSDKEINPGIGNFDRISVVNFSNDDKKFLIGSHGRSYKNLVICRAKDTKITKLDGHKDKIIDALFNEDATKVFSMSYDYSNIHCFKGWDVETGTLVFTALIEHFALTRCVAALMHGGPGFFQYCQTNKTLKYHFFKRIEEKEEIVLDCQESFDMIKIIDNVYKCYIIGIGVNSGDGKALEICFFNKNDGKKVFILKPKTEISTTNYIAYNPINRTLALEKRTDLILLTLPSEQDLTIHENNKNVLEGWVNLVT